VTQTSWYQRWFGEEYLQLYPHRDEQEARDAVDLVLGGVAPGEIRCALDLACGAGRHLAMLVGRGIRCVGLDLSLPLLTRARAARAPVVRGDMRHLPFSGGSFDLVTNFFTSFGYFPSIEEDEAVIAEIRRVLRPDGVFSVDFLNADRVRQDIVPREQREMAGRRIIITRHLVDNDEVVEKRIEIHDPANRLPHVFVERVRLYAPEHLYAVLEQYGLVPTAAYGDYHGGPVTTESPRVLLTGRAQ
jgi:SAM-dependent methyltransferase